MLSLNFVFPLTSKLIPPLQKLSRAKFSTHPNYSPCSEYAEVQPRRKLMTNKSSVPSASLPINRVFVLSMETLTLHTSIGRWARAQPHMVKHFEAAEEEFLFQIITSPTRFRKGNNPSLLDLAFTKYPDDVSSVQMLAPLGKSDHAVILLELQIQLLEDKQLPSFSWIYLKTRRSELVEANTIVNWHHIRHWKASTTCGLRLETGSWI